MWVLILWEHVYDPEDSLKFESVIYDIIGPFETDDEAEAHAWELNKAINKFWSSYTLFDLTAPKKMV